LDIKEILNSGPSIHENKQWSEIDGFLASKGLVGFTNKMEIGGYDIYVKTAWHEGSIIKIDITLSRKGHKGNGFPVSAKEATLEATRFDLAKSSLEEICIQASDLLQTGQVGIGHIIRDWQGREMFPSGWCPQLVGSGGGPTAVKGPLDAVSQLFVRRLVDWTEIMGEK
jgi:hypothetical protein